MLPNTADFQRLPFLSGEISELDLHQCKGISSEHLSDYFFRNCIDRGVQTIEIFDSKEENEKLMRRLRPTVPNELSVLPVSKEIRRKSIAKEAVMEKLRRGSIQVLSVVDGMNKKVNEFVL